MDDRSEHRAETITLTEPDDLTAGNFHNLLRQYVNETKRHMESGESPVIGTQGVRRVYFALAVAGLLALGGLGLAVMTLMQQSSAQSAARSLADYERELCVHRQQAVLRAITQYIHDYKEAPKDLSALKPPYLTVPPVDPVSGVPFRYAHEGNAVSLGCAKHPLTPEVAQR